MADKMGELFAADLYPIGHKYPIGHSSPVGDSYLKPWDMSPAGMGQLNGSYPYSSLDARELIDRGVARITEPGGKPDPAYPPGYSLVTHYNDLQPNSYTRDWPNKPAAYGDAQRAMANPASGMMYPGKYRQLLWSAQQRGMFD